MEENNKRSTKSTLPLKEINHQDIYQLIDLFEQINSWQEPLRSLEKYFNDDSRPLNKQKLAKQYYAQSKLFLAFISDFQRIMPEIEQKMLSLRKRKKLN